VLHWAMDRAKERYPRPGPRTDTNRLPC
jgi:hypothetical protein